MDTETIFSIKEIIFDSSQQTLQNIIYFWPNILGAIGVVLVGFLVSHLVYLLIVKSSKKLRIEYLSKVVGLKQFLRKLGIKQSAPDIIGRFLKGYILFMFCMGAAKIVKLNQIAEFMDVIIKYIPNMVVALFIVLIGISISDTVALFIKGALHFSDKKTREIISYFARFILIFFSILAALVRLKIAETLVEILFIGFIFMIALAGGLAFGLGGKDLVKQILEDQLKRSTPRKKRKVSVRRAAK